MISLAWRNFARNLSRYRVLLPSLMLAVVALVTLIGLVEGVTQAVREKSARYFAGDVTVQYYSRGRGRPRAVPNPEAVTAAIRDLELPLELAPVQRSLYTRQDSTLFFAGRYVNQRRLIGVDWEHERPVLETLDLVDGRLPEAGDDRGVLISAATAERLGARAGDDLVLSLSTDAGPRNTARLEVRGIFDEHSFFGYATYLQREALNRVVDLPEDTVHEIGLHLRTFGEQSRVAQAVHAGLAARAGGAAGGEGGDPSGDGDPPGNTPSDGQDERIGDVLPVFETRAERAAALDRQAEEGSSALTIMTLEAHLDEITNLLNALSLISAAVIGLFLLIVVIGVSNTFVMLTFERTREIGTLRAMGISRAGTLRLFVYEAAVMGLAAVAIGVPLGVGVLELLHRAVDLSGYPWATLFLVRGRLLWVLPPAQLVVVFLAVTGSAVIGCLRPAARAALLQPAHALQHD